MSSKKLKNISKIEQMSWEEIIQNYGALFFSEADILSFMSLENKDEKEFYKVRNELFNIINKNIQGNNFAFKYFSSTKSQAIIQHENEIIKYLEENSDFFDKIKLVMIIYIYRSRMEQQGKKNGIKQSYNIQKVRELKSLLKDAENTPQGKKTRLATLIPDEAQYQVLSISTIQTVLERAVKENKRQVKIFSEAKVSDEREASPARNMEWNLLLCLVRKPISIIREMNIDTGIKKLLILSSLYNAMLVKGKKIQEIEKITQEESNAFLNDNLELIVQHMAAQMIHNLYFMDIEGMVYSALKNMKDYLDEATLNDEQYEECTFYLLAEQKLLNALFDDKLIAKERKDLALEAKKIDEEVKSHMVQGNYISKTRIPLIKVGLYDKSIRLVDISQTLIEEIGIEKIPEDITYLDTECAIYYAKILGDNSKVMNSLRNLKIHNREKIDGQYLINVIESNILTLDNCKELYKLGIIDKQTIRQVENKFNIKFASIDQVMDSYVKAYKTNKKEDEESKTQFLEKSKEYIEFEADEFDQEEVLNELIERDFLTKKDITAFYLADLIGINQIAQTGQDIITNMLKENILKPQDIRNLYDIGSLTERDILETFRNMKSIDEQTDFIVSVFSGEQYDEICATLIENMNYQEIQTTKRTNRKDNNQANRKSSDSKNKENSSVFDFRAKYAFLTSLDKNVIVNHYTNGFKLFVLPNVKYPNTNEGTIIIEAFIDVSHNGKSKLARNKATYMMPLSLFRRYESEIIEYKTREVKTQEGIIAKKEGAFNLSEMARIFYEENELGLIQRKVHSIQKSKEQKSTRGSKNEIGWAFNILNILKSEQSNYKDKEELKHILENARRVQDAVKIQGD